MQLVYVSDKLPGIKRVRNGNGFYYTVEEKRITQKKILERIRKLVIPPAWEDVWICKLPEGHLQVTGIDTRKRKQYKYHPLWASFRNQTKFYGLYDFGKAVPAMRLQLEKHLALPGLPLEKVLAAVVSLMERTTIRVGNAAYEKLYGSFGLTTMKDKHVAVSGSSIKFSFKGKKGVHHSIDIKSKRLANIVRQCRDIPGKELFQYYDEKGNIHSIDSGMVNEYIRSISGGEYTSKDIRTWAGTVKALLAFKEIGPAENVTDSKRKVVSALDQVSGYLGNTRTVCRKYYVHPLIIKMYEEQGLQRYLEEMDELERDDGKTGLTSAEKILMKILESKHS
jgi:DNA topoisomerase-1